jgi:hypothetical protein
MAMAMRDAGAGTAGADDAGDGDADARAVGHLRLLLLPILTPCWTAVVAASAGVTAAA